jgi:hypothetical protein
MPCVIVCVLGDGLMVGRCLSDLESVGPIPASGMNVCSHSESALTVGPGLISFHAV